MEAGCTRDRVDEIRRNATVDPEIKWYRTFLNLTEGRGVCLFDAPDRDRLIKWLADNDMRYDRIYPVELESEHGEMIELPTAVVTGTTP
jgi:hypothetical protein